MYEKNCLILRESQEIITLNYQFCTLLLLLLLFILLSDGLYHLKNEERLDLKACHAGKSYCCK